jgi:hypothetical protein
MLRDNGELKCPFGLSISFACRNAGESVDKMANIEEMKQNEEIDEKNIQKFQKSNEFIFRWKASCTRCKYAGKLFENKELVECNHGSIAEGINEDKPAIAGSPLFYKMYSGIGIDGLYSFPLGYYTDNSIDHSMYYGRYSIESTGMDAEEVVKKIHKAGNKR